MTQKEILTNTVERMGRREMPAPPQGSEARYFAELKSNVANLVGQASLSERQAALIAEAIHSAYQLATCQYGQD